MAVDKVKSLEAALQKIEKDFGKGAIMRLGDASDIDISVIPTGILELDIALGVGGVPRGRIIEIYGPESSGKTTIALQVVAQAQKQGGIAAFIDAEHALDPVYAEKLGVDVDNLYLAQPDNGEQALEIADTLVRSGAVDIIVVDSVAALVPKSEIDGEMGDSFMGLQARLMSQALRKMAGVVNKSNTCIIFINQLREKIGVMFGNPETTTGGRALKFYATIRMDVRKSEVIKNGDQQVGNKVKIKIAKNKVAPPFRIADCEMIFGEGISRDASLLNLGVESGIIKKSGSWFYYNDDRIAQGRDNARRYIKENPQLAAELETRIREHFAMKNKPESSDDGEEG